jgi:hypothetical protein
MRSRQNENFVNKASLVILSNAIVVGGKMIKIYSRLHGACMIIYERLRYILAQGFLYKTK